MGEGRSRNAPLPFVHTNERKDERMFGILVIPLVGACYLYLAR
jgi:hypothetical protein